MKSTWLLSMACCMAVSLVSTGAAAQTIEADIARTSDRLDSAKSANLDLIAPGHVGKAERLLGEATANFEAGGKIDDIRKKLIDAHAQLEAAERLTEIGSHLLSDAIESRRAALMANAPEFAAREWADAEKTMHKAGQQIEKGNPNTATTEAGKARDKYSDAEMQAIRADELGTARDLRAEAIAVKANKLAPKTLAVADGLLDEAERVLAGDRYQRSEARVKVEAAVEEYQHAAALAKAVEALNKSGKEAPEELMIGYEAGLRRIAEALGFDARFSQGAPAVTNEILAAIVSWDEDRHSLQTKVAGLRAEKAALEERMVPLEESEAQLREKEKLEALFRQVRESFLQSEAEVLTSGDQLIIRLYGLNFPSGSSEIRPENFTLLTKVRHVMREFPKVPVSIEGHTDSQGDDAYNLTLSQNRANAVREYLLANIDVEPDWITALGYGEDKPVATNETAQGRAKNRRIDVIIDWMM